MATPHYILERIRNRQAVMKAVKGRVRKQKQLPKQAQPDNVRLEYFQSLRALLRDAHALLRSQLTPQLPDLLAAAARERGDADGLHEDTATARRVQAIIDGVSRQWLQKHSDAELANLATKYANATSAFQKKELGKQLKAAVGVDVLASEPNLAPRLSQFAVGNVSLIKTMVAGHFQQIETMSLQSLRTGTRAEDLSDDIEERYGVSESRAKLIARDQIGKLNGELNQVRQEELGVSRFIWRTMHDNRVRLEHEQLDGRSFDWDAPPDEGIPGEPINCRCFGEPDLTDLLSDLAPGS